MLETQGDMVLAAPNGRIDTQSKYHSRQVGVGVAMPIPASSSASKEKAAAPPPDVPQFVHYKGSSTKCSKYDAMTPEQQKTATAKDKKTHSGGPQYTKHDSSASLANFPWEQSGLSPGAQCAIRGVANNEGGGGVSNPNGDNSFNPVQSYDSQALTAGAMQKTISLSGHGELANQMSSFKTANPAKYRSLFVDKGWTVQDPVVDPKTHVKSPPNSTAYFQDLHDPNAQPLTGSALQDYIRQCNGANYDKTMAPWREVGRDPDFQQQQVSAFETRLHSTAIARVHSPNGEQYQLSDYISSSRGMAHVMDESVNAGPAAPPRTFNKAVTSFFSPNPKAPLDPTTWTAEQRALYEPQLMQVYGRERSGMTDGNDRWTALQQRSCLSDTPGSFN